MCTLGEFLLPAAEFAQQATQTQTDPDKKMRLLLEVLVAASAHDVLELFGIVWVLPPVVVWSVMDQMSIMVVGGVFVTDGVPERLFWDTSARTVHRPVTRAGTTAMREVGISDVDALSHATDVPMTSVVASWTQVPFDAILSVQVHGQSHAGQEHFVGAGGPVARLSGVEEDFVKSSGSNFTVIGLGNNDLAIPVLFNLLWSETNDLLDVVVRVVVWEGGQDFFHVVGDGLLQGWQRFCDFRCDTGREHLDLCL